MNAEDAGKERRDTGSGTEKQLPDSEATGTGGPIPATGTAWESALAPSPIRLNRKRIRTRPRTTETHPCPPCLMRPRTEPRLGRPTSCQRPVSRRERADASSAASGPSRRAVSRARSVRSVRRSLSTSQATSSRRAAPAMAADDARLWAAVLAASTSPLSNAATTLLTLEGSSTRKRFRNSRSRLWECTPPASSCTRRRSRTGARLIRARYRRGP